MNTGIVKTSQQSVGLKSLKDLVNTLMFTQGLYIFTITFPWAQNVLTLECFQALRSYIFWYIWKLQAQLLYWPIFSHEQLKLDSFLPPNMQNVNGEFY